MFASLDALSDLQVAAGVGSAEHVAGAIRSLSEHGENIEALLSMYDKDGQMLLHVVAMHAFPQCAAKAAMILVEAGAQLGGLNASGEPPLLCAVRAAASCGASMCSEERLSMVLVLLQMRADPNSWDDAHEETALMHAACAGDAPLCRSLLDARADPLFASKSGLIANDFAGRAPASEAVFPLEGSRALSGALHEARGLEGEAPDALLALARRPPSPAQCALLARLLGARASANAAEEKPAGGASALALAVTAAVSAGREGSSQAVALLLLSRADARAGDDRGRVPLTAAWSGDRADLCELLLDAGADGLVAPQLRI